MDGGMKEVYFEQYCKTCVNRDIKETEDPCNECLTTSARENSHKPIRYVESMKKKNNIRE